MNTQKVRDMLVKEEGVVTHVYLDHLGYLTIGVGHLLDERRGGRISHAAAMFILVEDIHEKCGAAASYPWFAGLDENRQAVVIGMVFQLGAAGFAAFKDTIAAIAAADYKGAARHMLDSKWARQTPARAKRMAEIMRTGEWPY